jgi:hypothetical protein
MQLIQQSFFFSSFSCLSLFFPISLACLLIPVSLLPIYTFPAPLLVSAPEAKQNGKQLLVIST